MSKPKKIHSAIHQLFGAEPSVGDAPGQPNAERFADGGGWAVSVTRGPRIRAAYSTNLAKREAAVADLKRAAATNKLYVWGTYENQRSKLHYVHGDPECPKANVVFVGIAAKLARGQLACGCNRRAAASARSLDLSIPIALAESRQGTLLSTEYRNNRSALRWQCEDGHQFSMTLSDAQGGRWCPRCWDSRANALCKVILQQLLNVNFEQEQTPDFLADASEAHGLSGMLRFDGWCESERIAFEHQGPQHYRPVTRKRARNDLTHETAAQHKFELIKRYDAIKAAACRDEATLIIIDDISAQGYRFAYASFIIDTLVAAVTKALPHDRLDAAFEMSVERLRALDSEGWQQLLQPIYAGSRAHRRLRDLAATKGGRVIGFTDDRHVILECANGHRWEGQINNVLGGTWCPVEGRQARAQKRRMAVAPIRTRLRGLGLRLDWSDAEFASRYRNNETPLPITREACEGRFERPLAKLHPGTRCPGCKNRTVCTGSAKKGKSRKDYH